MSFMVHPHPYDDINQVNVLDGLKKVYNKAIRDLDSIQASLKEKYSNQSFIFDYYLDHECLEILNFDDFPNHLIKDVKDFYIDNESFDEIVNPNLPLDRYNDPYLLFGKIYDGVIENFFNYSEIEIFFEENRDRNILLYGVGASSSIFRKYINNIVYYDRTPKDLSLIVSKENYEHLIYTKGNSFNEKLRQFYYIDMMVAMRLRKELITEHLISDYILKNSRDELTLLDWDSISLIFDALVQRPIRPKPVYLPGVWGGEMIKTVRGLQDKIKENIAWVFEFIPLESSLGIMIDDLYLDFPFYSFLNAKEVEVLGDYASERFGGFFPVRANYDDTWHSNGNMSIQVHPGSKYIQENYNEYDSQDEAYYIVATGHDAVTYCGLKTNIDEFLSYCKESFLNKTTINYKEFVNHIDSYPGLQFMIPGGTLHASGRNQLVLEHGSLTVGSYTYKLYDYVRKDLQGNARPIHLKKGADVLADRDDKWIDENVLTPVRMIRDEADFKEYSIGQNKTMYYQTRRIEINEHAEYSSNTNNEFALLALVGGQLAKISKSNHDELSYDAKYLDVLIIPASLEEYTIKGLGNQPIVVHKTILK